MRIVHECCYFFELTRGSKCRRVILLLQKIIAPKNERALEVNVRDTNQEASTRRKKKSIDTRTKPSHQLYDKVGKLHFSRRHFSFHSEVFNHAVIK